MGGNIKVTMYNITTCCRFKKNICLTFVKLFWRPLTALTVKEMRSLPPLLHWLYLSFSPFHSSLFCPLYILILSYELSWHFVILLLPSPPSLRILITLTYGYSILWAPCYLLSNQIWSPLFMCEKNVFISHTVVWTLTVWNEQQTEPISAVFNFHDTSLSQKRGQRVKYLSARIIQRERHSPAHSCGVPELLKGMQLAFGAALSVCICQ